jgi:hypothetical protein
MLTATTAPQASSTKRGVGRKWNATEALEAIEHERRIISIRAMDGIL